MSHFIMDCNLRFSVTIKDFAGTLIDPTGLRLELAPPGRSLIVKIFGTDAEVIKDSTGAYHCDHVMAEAIGEWRWRWISTGTGAGAHSGIVRVEP